MPQTFSAGEFRRRVQAAQRKAEREFKKAVADQERQLQREVVKYNRATDAHNRRVVNDVNDYNKKVDQHNRKVVADFNRRVRQARPTSSVRYTPEEQHLAERVQDALVAQGARDVDLFVSYARLDGAVVAGDLRANLEELGVSVWFDQVAIQPGKSQALQMDKGLRLARAGVVLLTPAYLAGRFWTERELGALLHKPTLIPVLHGVTFRDVAEYSGILPDLAGFETARNSVSEIAEKIAAVVLLSDAA